MALNHNSDCMQLEQIIVFDSLYAYDNCNGVEGESLDNFVCVVQLIAHACIMDHKEKVCS